MSTRTVPWLLVPSAFAVFAGLASLDLGLKEPPFGWLSINSCAMQQLEGAPPQSIFEADRLLAECGLNRVSHAVAAQIFHETMWRDWAAVERSDNFSGHHSWPVAAMSPSGLTYTYLDDRTNELHVILAWEEAIRQLVEPPSGDFVVSADGHTTFHVTTY